MDIKLVLSDIDGTILDDNNQVDDQLKNELKRLNDQDIPFVLASARSPEGMLPIAKKLGILNNPIVCYNGAYVVKDIDQADDQIINSHLVPSEEVTQILQVIAEKFPTISVNLYSKSKWYVEKLDEWSEMESEITNITPIVTNLSEFVSDNPVHKLLLIDKPKRVHQLMEYLEKMRFSDTSFVLSKDNYLEVTNKKASKKIALKELAKHYQIDLAETLAIGDNFNDVPMLIESGMGVAMDNAPKAVQSVANITTTSNNENGVSQILKKYIVAK